MLNLAGKGAAAWGAPWMAWPMKAPSITRIVACLLALGTASVLAADAGERKFIRKGMGEGEVILKIGKPDHEAFRRVIRGEPEEKTWTYFPHARDRQTMTVLTFHSGVVTEINRRIAR